MIHISALNEESNDESGSEEQVSRESLVKIAIHQYSKALDLQKKGNDADAMQLLKDLLDTEILYDVGKPAPGDKTQDPLFDLKFLCYKNLAGMLSAAGEVKAAIDAYCAAAELDDTDVTLWHRLGLLCMRAKHYEMALNAFQRGTAHNPRHWPCIDKIVTLLLGLDNKEQCIITIHDALQLDPYYLRGLAYRRHIYKEFKHMRDYMEYVNPIYKWNEEDDGPIDEGIAQKLLQEAEEIYEAFSEQQRVQQVSNPLPYLKLEKPISKLTWESVGDALVHMHHHMTENRLSHACHIEIVFETEHQEEKMEVCDDKCKEAKTVESKVEENYVSEKITDMVSENEVNENNMSDKDKPVTDNEKVESDLDTAVESSSDPKAQKKNPVRRRVDSSLQLERWSWCTTKRRSERKKITSKDDNIYDTLRKMVPIGLIPEIIQKKENQARDTSPDTSDLVKLYEEKDDKEDNYFQSETEQKDVKSFIKKYTEKKHDIIDMLKNFLSILAEKWRIKWPNKLDEVFVEANKCYNNHIDIPSCSGDNQQEILHYISVNLLAEEFVVNGKLQLSTDKDKEHSLDVINSIGLILTLKPHIFISTDCLENLLRQLWLKLHVHIINKHEVMALDCLYELLNEFQAFGEHEDSFALNIVNFTYKTVINKIELLSYVKFYERNMKLDSCKYLYEKGCFEELSTIVTESFDQCKNIARDQEAKKLDFAVHISYILDAQWALGKTENCLQWAFKCLNEALKHYFHYTSGSADYEKWTLVVVKILCCMEHILTLSSPSCLDSLTPKDLSQGLEDLIRIIGHQVETNAAEMPLDTVVPWILIHYILQREEDLGRGRLPSDMESCDDVPNPLKLLFIGHEQLGNRKWCCMSDGKLLFFILDTIVPQLRSPALSKSLAQVCQYMEQCVYCLFGHPLSTRRKPHHMTDMPPKSLDWFRAQQLYEIYRPIELPPLEGSVSGMTANNETLFLRILSLVPPDCDPQKYIPKMKKCMERADEEMPSAPQLLPYKMKDIYYLLGNHYFKSKNLKSSIKYNIIDIIVNNDRFESWFLIALSKALLLEKLLNSCNNFENDKDFLQPANITISCFKRSSVLNPNHSKMWTEYGNFAYAVHSFCSRLLKQASESLSMEDFESIEKQKEDMLDTTQKCFSTALGHLNDGHDYDKTETWKIFYMLGKVAEKRNKLPSVYLDYYMQGVKSLQEAGAVYPLKIAYYSPPHLCLEVLEMHYRSHASILKYIEKHENMPIPISVGKAFSTCIEEWQQGPFTKKKQQEINTETEGESKVEQPVHPANILKRSVSDAGEEDNNEAKRLKIQAAAAKVRRSASYDTERSVIKDALTQNAPQDGKTDDANTTVEGAETIKDSQETVVTEMEMDPITNVTKFDGESKENEKSVSEQNQTETEKKEETTSSSSTSSSDSSSSESSSDSSSNSSSTSETASKSSNEPKNLTEDELMKIVTGCTDVLEECASRFSQHYKAIYRLAHYHFYYKKGKDIAKCRDLMLFSFTSRLGHKLGGLFSKAKTGNLFNRVWKIPGNDIEKGGSFIFHMNRSILLTMEILKEIDDHQTLLELSFYLQKVPDVDKKYLRDSDREELAQQAFSLCVQSLKGQLNRFSVQDDLKSNEVEQQGLKTLMLDIYNSYLKKQMQGTYAKQFTNLLVDAYKLLTSAPRDNKNLMDVTLKYCQLLKNQTPSGSSEKSQNVQKKQAAKASEIAKSSTPTSNIQKSGQKSTAAPSPVSGLPKLSPHDLVGFSNYMPQLYNDQVQAAAALQLSYLSKIGALALQDTLQSSIPYSLHNSFQAEFYRQCVGQSFSAFNLPPPKKQKRGPKPGSTRTTSTSSQLKASTSREKTSNSLPTSTVKAIPTSVITSQKSASASMAPSMGTVLSTLPASMTANLSSFGAHGSHSHTPTSTHTAHSSAYTAPSNTHSSIPAHAHMTSASTLNTGMYSKPPMPHQQVSPGKTLQEKLAERQKNLPSVSKATPEMTRDIVAQSISRLPSSLTITKTSASKQPLVAGKRPEPKKSLPFSEPESRPKPITSDEIIVLDDD